MPKVVVQGFLSPGFIAQGYESGTTVPLVGSFVVQGLGTSLIVTQGYGPPSPVSTYDSLIAAVRAAVLAALPSLDDAYRDSSVRRAHYPMLVLSDIGESPELTNGKADYPAWAEVQFTFIDEDEYSAEALRNAAYKLFWPDGAKAKLLFADGWDSGGRLPGRKWKILQPAKGPQGKSLWAFCFSTQFFITRFLT